MLDPGSWDQIGRREGEGLLKRFHQVLGYNARTSDQQARQKRLEHVLYFLLCPVF